MAEPPDPSAAQALLLQRDQRQGVSGWGQAEAARSRALCLRVSYQKLIYFSSMYYTYGYVYVTCIGYTTFHIVWPFVLRT